MAAANLLLILLRDRLKARLKKLIVLSLNGKKDNLDDEILAAYLSDQALIRAFYEDELRQRDERIKALEEELTDCQDE